MTINNIKSENKLFASKKQELENKKEMILKDDERSEKYKHEQVTAIERSLADLINNKEPLIAEMIEQEQKRLQEKLANVSYDLSVDDVQKEILKELRVARVSSELVSRYKDKNTDELIEQATKEIEEESIEALAYIHAMKLLEINPIVVERLENRYLEYVSSDEAKEIKQKLNDLEIEFDRLEKIVNGDPFMNILNKYKR
ncbi:hypothetical protein M2901_10070 (plasmid) [Vagococcus lutrae]|uniref:hypothetical protein n=1 Tax=Vagococcus lutrae TaxID=81947 RepID=UPI00200DC1A3|nr:hypothetical protein [Vagococcus lutrae]UQF72095.1 hypothetical protein M2901_10070 [Vagococcus lutrae]